MGHDGRDMIKYPTVRKAVLCYHLTGKSILRRRRNETTVATRGSFVYRSDRTVRVDENLGVGLVYRRISTG